MIPIPLPYKALALVLMCAGMFSVGWFNGRSSMEEKLTEAKLEAVQKAREREAQWQTDVSAVEETHDEELRQIADAHARDLAGLRNRAAARMPAAAACSTDGQGATGQQLSRDDAAFLVRFAAERDASAADLRACQSWVEAVTR